MTTLDVGCGNNPQGDINIDLFPKGNIHRSFQKMIHCKNFVKADAHCLPFRSEAFEQVFCNHLLEHKGIRYREVIKEMLRVGGRVTVEVPTILHKWTFSVTHGRVFTTRSLGQVFRPHKYTIQPVRNWHQVRMMKTPFDVLGRLVQHSKYVHSKVVNPLHLLPCPFTTSIRLTVDA